MITNTDIRKILSGTDGVGSLDGLSDDAELVIDSLALLVLQAGLARSHGITIDPRYDEMQHFTSITKIRDYVSENRR